MQKIINDPNAVVDEMLEGYLKAFPDLIARTDNPHVLKYRAAPVAGKVGIVSGGGSGHKPAFIGYVGRNMLDAVAVGEIFTSPPARMFYDAFKAANAGQGVACLYGNYAGDVMNVKMAIEMAGEVLMWKIGGAKAAMGGSLDQVIAAAQKAIDNTRSMGIGLGPCTIPAVGHPNFNVEPGKMEVGIGHHGESGLQVVDLEPADRIAGRLVDIILPDLPFQGGDEVAILLSGLGATPLMELFILYREVERLLRKQGIGVYRPYVGNYFTSLEMAGVTLTVLKLDPELKSCIDFEADSMGLRQFPRG